MPRSSAVNHQAQKRLMSACRYPGAVSVDDARLAAVGFKPARHSAAVPCRPCGRGPARAGAARWGAQVDVLCPAELGAKRSLAEACTRRV